MSFDLYASTNPKKRSRPQQGAARTYAIYMVPKGKDHAVRHRDFQPFDSARAARETRRRLGPDACIHVGLDHPNPLPYGETLWLDLKSE